MGVLLPVDRVEIHVLIDNATDSLSSMPAHAESEFVYQERHGLRELAGEHLCCACHGLSYLVTAYRGATRHSVLFDTGPAEDAFARNVERLHLDLTHVESIVLSHGHWDHAGAMLGALDLIGARSVPCYVHPGMFRSRARRLSSGAMLPSRDVPSIDALTEHGARVVCSTEPQTFLDDMFFLSGEIPRVTSFERGLAGHFARSASDDDWTPDPWIMDERWLAVHVTGKGLIVFTACSHAGVVNVLHHARACFTDVRLYGVAGGFHLAGPNEPIIPETVTAMRSFGLEAIAAGHCTGWRAMVALANAFGEGTIDHAVVGKRYSL